jgi:hypothetical protein
MQFGKCAALHQELTSPKLNMESSIMRKPVLMLAILVTAASHADTLTDLRVRLQAIKPTTPLTARIELRSNRLEGDDDDQLKTERNATIEAVHDTNGIHLNWTSALLEKAQQQEANSQRNPDAPKLGVLAPFDANVAVELLDAAPNLLLTLEGATVVESKADQFQSKPATLLTLKLRPSLTKKDKKRVKKYDYSAKLWLDTEGWPVAMESLEHSKASMMLISFITDTKEKRIYSHSTERLFVTTSSHDLTFEGFGQKTEEHTTTTVTTVAQGGCTVGCRSSK